MVSSGKSKYGNRRTNGYASKREARRAAELKLMEREGLISDLQEQVPFELAPAVTLNGLPKRPLTYVADFTYIEGGKLIMEDSKGCLTDVFRIKKHLMKHLYSIEILET